jgi:hypothetical protein
MQLSQRNGQLEGLKSDIVTQNSLLSKRASDFAQVMERVERYGQELAAKRRVTVDMLKKKEALLDLEFRYYRLFENLGIAKMRKMALYFESGRARNVHPCFAMSAINPELLTQLRYRQILSARVNAADAELKSLTQKRDEIAKRVTDRRGQLGESLPKETLVAYMDKYSENLAIQEAMISAMAEMVHAQREEAAEKAVGCRGARLRLTQRKEHALQLKRRTTESQGTGTPSTFCTEQRPLFMERGTLSKPSPPEPNHSVVPPIATNLSAIPRLVGAPQSQRSRRQGLMELRKKLTRPVQTARKPS